MKRLFLPILLGLVLAPFASDAEQAVTLGEYSLEARRTLEGRLAAALRDLGRKAEVSGIVTAVGDDCFFLQQDTDGLRVLTDGALAASGRLPAVGSVVAVSGRPILEGGRVVFAAQTMDARGTAELPPARAVGAKDLVYTGPDSERDVNWLLVEVEGRALGLTERGFALDLDGVPVNVLSRALPDFLENCAQTHPKVRVRGVAEVMLDQSALFGRPRFAVGVRLTAQSAADIVFVPDATYLLNVRDRRVMLAGVALMGLLLLALGAAGAAIFRQRRRSFRTATLMAERKRMADDLHDTIEQHLVGAGMLVNLGRTKEAQDVLVRAKREIRDIVWGLKNDDMMRLSPTALIRQLAHDETTRGICRVEAKLEGLPAKMDARSMRDLSLIVREAIGNAVKHGGAKKVAISSDALADGGWLLRIANDGRPFDAAQAPGPADGHFGLEGMRERARRLRATVSFSTRGGWTVVSVTCGAGARACGEGKESRT